MSSSERQHWQKKIAPEGSYGELWACSSEGAGYLRSVQRLFLYFFFIFFFNFETKPTLLKHSGCSGAGSAVSASRSGCLLRARAAAPSASTSICAAARWSGSGNGSSWTLIPGGKRKKRKKKAYFPLDLFPSLAVLHSEQRTRACARGQDQRGQWCQGWFYGTVGLLHLQSVCPASC